MEIVILWLFFSFVAAAISSNKGRGAGGVFLLSLVLSPLIGIIVAALLKPNTDELDRRAIKSGKQRRCPHCAESIKADALVCRYCGRDIPVESPADGGMKKRGLIK